MVREFIAISVNYLIAKINMIKEAGACSVFKFVIYHTLFFWWHH